ncbi:hypothetical protein CHH49_18100 [Terribacillus saccharophilus]|uniref:hypothetical protein n=1 Tax=Terribacillus saccharophilus TaxID=361277 RepID=UPI000BA76010|nr:hypothetical protein [Terribacillus saccharophilus]PAF20059.1 hypothetical protein CHH49_18100 [Terribacillus saccharophilus]
MIEAREVVTLSNTPGYLTAIKSRGYTYIQLRKSVFDKEKKGKVKKEIIFSFGSTTKALQKMYAWREEPRMFPDKLSDLGYNFADLENWIKWMEQKTKNEMA